MKDFVQNKIHPNAFHMNWNLNKETKQQFLEQIGLWYVKDDMCLQQQPNPTESAPTTIADFTKKCCAIEPIIRCHYRDKPSTIPCHDSPMIEEQIPFW